ncbi:MAG: polyprenyl synthetase family protein [Chloroflexota bacterium]|nr:polyprenyl synthetase family protein [Chloroflexota bacterium]
MDKDELQILIEQELFAQLESNYTLLANVPSVSNTLLNELQNQPWRDQIRYALGLEEHHECEGSAQSCTKSKMPLLSTKLVALTYGANGKDPREIVPALAGVFLVQQASSILDDIQDRDRDDSLDNLLNISTAMNIALLMLSRGQELITCTLARSSAEDNKTATSYLKLVTELNKAVGTALRGQLLDLQENSVPLPLRTISVENYVAKIVLKSSSRFSFLAELGARLGGATDSLASGYRQFGFVAGIALNLMSDLYDFAGAGEEGIEECRDYRTGVFNLPLIYAYESQETEAAKQEFLQVWQQSLNSPEYLQAFKEKLNWNLAYQQTIAAISSYIGEAERVLKQIDPALEKQPHRDLVWLLQQHISPEVLAG